MIWNQSIPGATFNVNGNNTNSPIGTFSWIPTNANANTIPYYFTVSVTDDACPINASYSYSYSITINQNPDAGISNTISVCETDPAFNMFAQLGGSPTGGGSWFDPYYNLVGNNFNPAIDSAGIYTYVLDSVGNCPGDTAYITVNVTPPPNAGTNGVITVCTADPPFDMFLQLGGNPLVTGSWTDNNGNPVSSLFDPASMNSGTYTYTVLGAGSCLDESSTVTVTVNTSPGATLSVNSPICSGDSVFLNVSLIGQGPFATIISDGINNYNYSVISLVSTNFSSAIPLSKSLILLLSVKI